MAIIDFTTPQGIKRATYVFSGMIVAGHITFEQAMFILERAYTANVWKGDYGQLERVTEKIYTNLQEAVWAGEQIDDYTQSAMKGKAKDEMRRVEKVLRSGFKLKIPKETK